MLRDVLAEDGLTALPKTSGNKGMQLTVPIEPAAHGRTSDYAKAVALRLEQEHEDLILSRMTKALRPGKVLVDWSQNNAAKTTVCVYSVRAREHPTVSTPLQWAEIEAGGLGRFTTDEVLERVEEFGDLHAPALTDEVRAPLPQ